MSSKLKELTVDEAKRLLALYDLRALAGEVHDLLESLQPLPAALRWESVPGEDRDGPEAYLEGITLIYPDGKQRALQYEDADEHGQHLTNDKVYHGEFYSGLTSIDATELDELAPGRTITLAELKEISSMKMPRLFTPK